MLKKMAFVVLALVLLSPVAASAQDPRAANGTVLLGYDALLSPPDVKCVPVGDAMPCPPGTTNVIGRSEVQVWMPVSPSKQVARFLSGSITFVVNCDLNGSLRGPCWGTFEWMLDAGGTWSGFWTAPIMDLLTYESQVSMVGVGSGGEIAGKRLELTGAAAPGDWYIASSVHIK